MTPPAGPAPPDPVVIDGGDRSCVRLLLKLRGRLAALPAGTVVHLLAGDPAAPLDLAAWCHLSGHTYLGPVNGPVSRPASGSACGTNGPLYPRPAYALRVSAQPRATEAHAPWRLRR